ncbi:LSM domain-containing protein [Beauveria bassiana ARSEF 2860]|uniref:U6 snRNA-associated Sm-like protein LSm1 n=1 Tax=Beauveria bassiana (strain ARSEF 2860) TaxID=655819 RepID=J4ULH4_BEAB2|nr:LSM domain-containing protein [Beauveria bassiana ARSEF 2860]EJP65382.1 LSM domain-containing protein [Beauveria bassiana ARSEF 2860]
MENLTIAEPPHQGGGGMTAAVPPPAQLPPQMFTTAAQLLDLTDRLWCAIAEKLMVVLRDGRKLVGVLRSWDQFANIVLQSTTERIFALQPPSPPPTEAADSETTAAATATTTPRGLYADIFHGIFLVRGENVLLLGEMDLDRDDIPPRGYEQGELALVRRLAEESKAREKSRDKARARKLARLGFEGDAAGEIVLL